MGCSPCTGDTRTYRKTVTEANFAAFEGKLVHPVCSTFALAQAVERASRLLVLDLKEEDEEGIGTRLEINHLAPAFLGEEVVVVATLRQVRHGEVVCSVEARVGERLWQKGKRGRKF